eukprot:2507067-Karenia_brevis.AAC.1
MRELSDGVMASFLRKKVLEEAGRGWAESYHPRTAYFMDCMVGAYGHDNKNIYEGIRMLLISQRLDHLVVKAYQRKQINYEQLEYILKSFHAR